MIRHGRKRCAICAKYISKAKGAPYSQLQGGRQTQKSSAGKWVGAGGISGNLLSRLWGSSQHSLSNFARQMQRTHSQSHGAPVSWQRDELQSLNYSTFISQIYTCEARAKEPNPRIKPVWLFPESGAISEEHFNFEQLVTPVTVTGFLSGSLPHGSAWLAVEPLHNQVSLADFSAPRVAGLSLRYLAG